MGSRTAVGALVGVLSAGVALGVGELVAVFVRPAAAPIIVVANQVVLLAPESATKATISSVGSNDKLLLFVGLYVALAIIGAAIGMVAIRSVPAGLAGVGLVGAFGVFCALADHASRPSDVVPTIIGTLASMAVLAALARLAGATADPEPTGSLPDRRTFLAGALGAAALAAVSGFGGRAAQYTRYNVSAARNKVSLPAATGESGVPAGADLGKSGVPWATPNANFYRVDTALQVPQVDPAGWRLRIHGLVDHPMTMSYDELLARPQIERWITLCCVSNPVGGPYVGNALFRGTLLADVLREAGLQASCDQLLLTSVDGMTLGAPTAVVMDGRDALLAVGMNGEPLPVEHGFPVRTVVPGLYGYVSACKWIVDIEATTFAKTSAYWVDEGYAAHPPIILESRIDTPRPHKRLTVGQPVAIAGVAWDQHVGVSKVEVQVDDGPWQTARLATVPSTDTWRQWLLTWTPEQPGEYRLRVRATDAHGQVQTDHVQDSFPAGASGLHTITVHATT